MPKDKPLPPQIFAVWSEITDDGLDGVIEDPDRWFQTDEPTIVGVYVLQNFLVVPPRPLPQGKGPHR